KPVQKPEEVGTVANRRHIVQLDNLPQSRVQFQQVEAFLFVIHHDPKGIDLKESTGYAEGIQGIAQGPSAVAAFQYTEPIVISLEDKAAVGFQGLHTPGSPEVGNQLGPLPLDREGAVIVSAEDGPLHQLQAPYLTLGAPNQLKVVGAVDPAGEQSLIGAQVHMAVVLQGRIDQSDLPQFIHIFA